MPSGIDNETGVNGLKNTPLAIQASAAAGAVEKSPQTMQCESTSQVTKPIGHEHEHELKDEPTIDCSATTPVPPPSGNPSSEETKSRDSEKDSPKHDEQNREDDAGGESTAVYSEPPDDDSHEKPNKGPLSHRSSFSLPPPSPPSNSKPAPIEKADESLRDLQRQLADQLEDRIDGLVISPSESRRSKGPARLLQTLQYVNLLEDRMSYLEREVDSLKKAQETEAASDEASKRAEIAKSEEDVDKYVREDLESGCCEASYEDFQTHDCVSKYVLTYLTEETFDWNRPRVELELNENRKIARVSINSKVLLKWFQSCLPKDAAPTETCRIVTAPFKPFCMLEQKIRDRAAVVKVELERRVAAGKDDKHATTGLDAPIDKLDDAADEVPETENNSAGKEETQATPPTHVSDAGSADKAKAESEEAKGSDMTPDTGDDELRPTSSRLPAKTDDDDLSELCIEAVEEMAEHFEALVHLLDTQLKEELQVHKRLRHEDATSVSFGHLWHLFHAGQVVYSDETQAYMVLNVRGGRPLYGLPSEDSQDHFKQRTRKHAEEVDTTRFRGISNYSPFSIDCVHIDFDGKDFGPVGRTFTIDHYQGEKELSLLPVIPLRLCKPTNGVAKEKFLVQRGRTFELLTRQKISHRSYEGTSLAEKNNRGGTKSREQIDSHIIIDFEHAYLKDAQKPEFCLPASDEPDEREVPQAIQGPCDCSPTCTAQRALIFHFDDRKLDRAEKEDFLESNDKLQLLQNLDDEHRMLLPCYVYAYVLRNLDWYRLDVDLVRAVDPTKSTNFQDLVLPETNKTLIKALVRSGRSGLTGFARKERLDLVRGKGQGVIILLHGVPGTGKSSTAECIAEHLKCPLFAITCGNIGVTPQEVEGNLRDMFYLAHKWNCVMLLDEADVFLQKRDEHDMSRNAVVSVFLRSLEYYSGILFLTTNKVGKFDEAFVSRIHMSLYYPMLNEQMTEDIWKVNLRRTKNFKPHIDFNEPELLSYAKHHYQEQQGKKRIPWNGRQIRNAFQTAIALAEFEAEEPHARERERHPETADPSPTRATMTWRHFQQVADVSIDFNEYLRKTHGGIDMYNLAYQDQDRYDERNQQTNGFTQSHSPGPSMNFGSSFNPNAGFNPVQSFQPDPNLFNGFQSQSSMPQRQQNMTNSSRFQPANSTFNPTQMLSSVGGNFQPMTPLHQGTSSQTQPQTPNTHPPPQVAFNHQSGDPPTNQLQNMFSGQQGPQPPSVDQFSGQLQAQQNQPMKPQQNQQFQIQQDQQFQTPQHQQQQQFNNGSPFTGSFMRV